jgi:hypothetical protein
MTMSVATDDAGNRIAADYVASDRQSQVMPLAKLADWLSLMARDTYDREGGVADSARLRAASEAQNRILAQLVRLLTADDRRYPSDVFANILVDQFRTLGLDAAGINRFAAECAARAKQPRRMPSRSGMTRAAAATLRRSRRNASGEEG